MSENVVASALQRGIAFLRKQQRASGNFEGQLSSSTFPSCAYAWVQLVQGETPDSSQLDWFITNQNGEGEWGLDAANISNREATLFAKLILSEVHRREPNSVPPEVLEAIPSHPFNLALIKLAYAAFNQFDWNELTFSEKALPLMKMAKRLTQIPFLRGRLQPPRHRLPPVAMFNTPLFDELFIAEQHTLVPVFLMIELQTKKRPELIASLAAWLKARVLSDGSWFRVNYITALSVLALIALQKEGSQSGEEIAELIARGIAWLRATRNPDGGCREAVNLNVWDTALSLIALTEVGAETEAEESGNLVDAAQWLVAHQNSDGGWAFSGLRDSSLPSDADDSALATLALIRVIPLLETAPSGAEDAIQRGIAWLKQNQDATGSWSTYQPGQGDVGCVSITAHAIEALLAFGRDEACIARGIHWLRAEIQSDGYWHDLWLAKRTYGTACAIIALVKAGVTDAPEIARGVRWLESAQNADGGWGEDMFGNPTDSTVEQTAWSTYALLLVDSASTGGTARGDARLESAPTEGPLAARASTGGAVRGDARLESAPTEGPLAARASAGGVVQDDARLESAPTEGTARTGSAAQKGIDFLCRHQTEEGSWRESCVGIYWEIIGGYADPINASVFPLLALKQCMRGYNPSSR